MALTGEQKITYMANIVYVARADGKISIKETEALENIQKAIGCKKTDLNKAYEMAEAQDYEMCLVGHWTDQVKNLEDVIFVSMVDGVDNSEQALIIDYARKVKVSQEQFSIILKDVKNRIAAEASVSVCPGCKAKLQSNVKFCPECGTPIGVAAEKKAVSVSYKIPKTGIAIEFAESTAGGFALAVKDQKAAPVNGTCLRAKKTWYLAAWPDFDIIPAAKLAGNLKGMRNRKVYVDGEELQWDEVFGFAWCANQRDTAYRPFEYCFGLDEKRLNIWGCKQARLEWAEWADWFSYGTFEGTGLLKKQICFKFDKPRIKHELETNLFKYRYCPHLRFDLIEAVLKEFPDEVMASQKGGLWGFKRDYNESPGALKITERSSQDGFTYTDEYYSSGVVPNSIEIAMKILKKAAESCGFKSTEIKGVLAFKD